MSNYKEAGVDIEKGDLFVEEIKKISKSKNIGLFGSVFEVSSLGMKNPVLVSGADGVGTKLKLAQKLQKHDTIGIDLVAMCANDVLCHGAKPIFFLDYIGTGKLEIEAGKQIIQGIVKGCELANCELAGGETAEMPGMYKGGEYDLAGFCVGAVEKESLLPKTDSIVKGDIVIGLPSSGVHSNGFSLVNKILETSCASAETLYALLEPTKIYVKEMLPLFSEPLLVKACAHITGGGIYGNISRVLPAGSSLEIDFSSFKRPWVFDFISKEGKVPEEEMRKVFNLGVGFAIIASKGEAERVLSILKDASIIGKIS